MDQPSPHLSCTKCAKCTTDWLPKSAKTAIAQKKGEQWHYYHWSLLFCLVSVSPQGRRGRVDSSAQVQSPTFVHWALWYAQRPRPHLHCLYCEDVSCKVTALIYFAVSHSINVSSAFGCLSLQCSWNSFFNTLLFRFLSFEHTGNALQIASLAHIQVTSLLSSSQQLAPAT